MRSRTINHTSMRLGDLLLPVGPLYRASEEHLEAREGLLAQLGQYQAVVAYQSAERGGLTVLLDEQIPLVLVDPDAIGDVTIVDLDDSEAATARAGEAAILDDLLKSLDSSALDALIREASTDSPAVAALLDALAQEHGIVPEVEAGDGGDDFDTTPDDDGPTRCQLGDVWVIGGVHRLLVGDCTDPANVARLMQGERADMAFTDPPYGVAYDGTNRPDKHSRQYDSILENDERETVDVFATITCEVISNVLKDGGVIYLFTAIMVYPQWRVPFEKHFKVRAIPIWVKDNPAASRSDFFWGYEPMLYGTKEGHTHTWNGGRGQNDIWQFRSVNSFGYVKDDGVKNTVNDAQQHPTQKPLDLVMHGITLSSNAGELVVDPFLGSGTTLIAAHRTGRRCYGMEIAPKYGDVILRRAEAEGLTVERVND